MCAISAVFAAKDSLPIENYIKAMTEIQNHRGPDCKDSYIDPNEKVGLGHNRLAILDLSQDGCQPMFNEDGNVIVVFNGEIYNYISLKEKLMKQGHEFHSSSDTEVLVHLYEEHGTDFLSMLNGVYAFVIYDKKRQIMFGARDRVGEKPFVYAEGDFGVAIASEIPAIKCIGGVDLSYSSTAIGMYLLRNMRHIPDPYTIYNGIKRLKPGHAMIIEQGKINKIWRYWHPNWNEKDIMVTDVENMLKESIGSRMIADVEIGAMLSGGVDSSAIVYGMQQVGKSGIRTYAFGLDRDDEELHRARKMADFLGTTHKEYYFEPEKQYQYFKDLLRIYGEPIMLLPLLHAYELCKHIKEDGLKVVLSGNGADELFYGYNGNNSLALISSFMKFVPDSILRTSSRVFENKVHNQTLSNALMVIGNPPGYRKSGLYKKDCNLLNGLIKETVAQEQVINPLIKEFSSWFTDSSPQHYIDESNVIGLLIENAHSVTISADLSSMAVGLESRAPFLNQDMVEMAWHMNYKKKIPSFRDKSHNKWILKKALEKQLPSDLLYAKKQGFGYNISEEVLLRNQWKDNVDKSFNNIDDFRNVLDLDSVQNLKRQFDNGDPQAPAMTIAKLFALFTFNE